MLSKRPLDVFDHARILANNKRNVDVIFTSRDPRALLVSKHKLVPDDFFYHADFQYFCPKNQIPKLINPGLLKTQRAINQFKTSLTENGRRNYTVAYERLISTPDVIQKELQQSLNLTFKRHFTEVDIEASNLPMNVSALNGVRKLETSRIDFWQKPEFKERLRDQFDRFPKLFGAMEEMGYSWTATQMKEYFDVDSSLS